MHIAITTPTGNIGRELVRILQSDTEYQLTLLARDPSKLATETAAGATVQQGDLVDADFLVTATQGVDALFFLIPPDFGAEDFRGYQNEVASNGVGAVRENYIKHVVLLSSVGAQHAEGTGPIAGLHDAEIAFRETGANVTALRPAWFMENYLPHIETIRSDGHIYMPLAPDARVAMIATTDIARAAVDALATPPDGFEVRELLGPRDVTLEEAATTIGEVVGKPVQHIQVTPDQARAAFLAMGIGESLTGLWLEVMDGFNHGRVKPEFPRTEQATTPTELSTFVASNLKPAIQRPA